MKYRDLVQPILQVLRVISLLNVYFTHAVNN